MGFWEDLGKGVDEFLNINKNEVVRIISHHDSDGISGAAILIKMLMRKGMRFSLSMQPYLSTSLFEDIEKEDYKTYIFVDIGSSEMKNINKYLKDKKVFVLDHHIPNDKANDNVIEINPWNHGIDGSTELCGSAIAYYFAKGVDDKNKDLGYLAIIGAIGDIQNMDGEYYQSILKEDNKVMVINDIKIYGAYSRSLFKVLSTTTEPYIPGVSGSDIGTVKFLKSCGIPVKKGKEYTKLSHLTTDDKNNLVKGILGRNPELKKEDIVGTVYLLKNESKGSPLRDCREFSTMLNACGRLEKPSVAIGACLGNKKLKKEAISYLREYRRTIIDAFSWFDENRNNVIVKDSHIIFNANDMINPNLISVVTTIIANSTLSTPNTFVVGMARDNDMSKISFRLSKGTDREYDLIELIKEIPYLVTYGGHKRSAGALLKVDDEERFIEDISERFEKRMVEEVVH